ncbi:hypothetical protein AUR66_16575 [Haloferax profundi]|uniref:Uncharacterized protein n=1 Tax=Haloferax profundi TaxID=1544718 RepID=A0A0W1SF83_9EURY|nr:hypothetical protein AUR66_16575 [Haloferax profundi]
MALSSEDLNEIDSIIVEYLVEGRVTPVYLRERIIDEKIRESISEQYLGQRLKRLQEHNHVKNLYDTGLYELQEDPRD